MKDKTIIKIYDTVGYHKAREVIFTEPKTQAAVQLKISAPDFEIPSKIPVEH